MNLRSSCVICHQWGTFKLEVLQRSSKKCKRVQAPYLLLVEKQVQTFLIFLRLKSHHQYLHSSHRKVYNFKKSCTNSFQKNIDQQNIFNKSNKKLLSSISCCKRQTAQWRGDVFFGILFSVQSSSFPCLMILVNFT